MNSKGMSLEFTADQILKNMPHPFFVKDRNARYIYCNEQFAKMVGLPSESILGKSESDIHPPHLSAMFCRQDEDVMQSGLEKSYLRQFVVNGRSCYDRTVKVPYRNDQGEIVGVLAYIEDVTEQQEAQQELEVKSLAIETGAAVAIAGPDGTITYVNQAFLALWRETSVEAVLGKNIYEFHANSAAADSVIAAIHNRDYWQGELLSQRRDGSTFTTMLSAAVTRDATGKVVNMLATFMDISGAKEREHALRVSENRLDQVAQGSKTFVWEIDREGLLMYVSDYIQNLTGYRPADLVGRIHFYDLHPAVGWERFREKSLVIIRKGESFQELIHPLETKDGEVIWVATSGIPLYDAEDTLLGYRGSGRDITEFHALQEDRE